MEALSSLVTKSLPSYLNNLPIPNSVGGFAQLSGKEWLQLLPFVGTVSLIVYVTVQALCIDDRKKDRPAPVNHKVEKNKAKVVHTVDSAKLVEKQVAYCRCWKSKKFPLCDGSHNEHNATTGDNVGPLLVKKLEYCNPCVEKDTAKVVNSVDIEDLAEKDKTAFCRCWRSKKFPYCDGSHNKHNEETGDNVGPLIVKKAA